MKQETKLTVRKPILSYERTNRYYLMDNSIGTHLMNAMQIIVPLGEAFFIRSVKRFVEEVNPQLKKEVKAFIGQENIHKSEHIAFWKKLEDQGFNLEPFRTFYDITIYGILEPAMLTYFGPKFPLAVTVALEHYTAVMSAYLMEQEPEVLETMAEGVQDLIRWHFAEELEHKSVAFDVLAEVDGNYLRRVGGMLLASALLGPYMFLGALSFMIQDKELTLSRLWNDLWKGKEKLASLSKYTLQQVVDYFRVDFHPTDNDNEYLIEKYMPQEVIAKRG
ncbi:MAG: metal-dependent hydrolase [Candidatus Hydrogenedentota bacterium]|nr:MAG: metal-dependent hydrolase [Candidatus Hydrogenedentota bacterium]